MISIVMGRRVRGVADAFSFLTPFKTISSLGVSCSANSLCRPVETCRLRTADRYTLIVWYAKPCWARWPTNISSVSFVAGMGVVLASLQKLKYRFCPA